MQNRRIEIVEGLALKIASPQNRKGIYSVAMQTPTLQGLVRKVTDEILYFHARVLHFTSESEKLS